MKMFMLAISLMAINVYAEPMALTATMPANEIVNQESVKSDPTPSPGPVNPEPRVKRVLTPQQSAARQDFKNKYKTASPEERVKMKSRLKTDTDLRLKLGLKRKPNVVTPPAVESGTKDQK